MNTDSGDAKKTAMLHVRMTDGDRRTLRQLTREVEDRACDTAGRSSSALGRAMLRFALLHREEFVVFAVSLRNQGIEVPNG